MYNVNEYIKRRPQIVNEYSVKNSNFIKAVSFILMICLIMSLASCSENPSAAPGSSSIGIISEPDNQDQSGLDADQSSSENDGSSQRDDVTAQISSTQKIAPAPGFSSESYPTVIPDYGPESEVITAMYPSRRLYKAVTDTQKWCYRNLNANGKKIYQIINQMAVDMTKGLVPLGKCTYPELALAYNGVKTDHPEYFWLPAGYIYEIKEGTMYIGFDHSKGAFDLSYTCTKDERKNLMASIKKNLIEASGRLTVGMSEYQREKVLHDWLNERITYDKNTAANTTNNPNAFNIRGSLIGTTAVCEGYSRAMQLLLNFAGIESTLVGGQIGHVGHMWNAVRADGSWYHLDATWNDTGDRGMHSYFNLNTAMITVDHVIDPDFSKLSYDDIVENVSFNYLLPDCSSIQSCYFTQNGTMIHSNSAFAEIISSGLTAAVKNKKTSVEFIFGETCPETFESYDKMIKRIKSEGVIAAANANLAENEKIIESNIICSGIPGSKGFQLSFKK